MRFYRQTAIRPNLERRARVFDAVRSFFTASGFLEIETPVRIPAPAPEMHIDAQESGDWFLQTSPELCMKRLLAAGYEKIFQISRCFRKGERGNRHVPEMTLLEWAEAHDLDFVPLAEARCDLVVPVDLSDHPTVRIVLDVLQSIHLRREIDALAGYASTATGHIIAELNA